MAKFHRLMWLAVGASTALLLSSCVVQEGEEGSPDEGAAPVADVGQDPASGDIKATLAVQSAKVSATDRVIVTITLTNVSSHPVRLLGWYAPADELEEDLFSVSIGDQPVQFYGPHYKRPAPEPSDFLNLPAGKSVTRDVDLTGFYDLSKSGDYTVRYAATLSQSTAQGLVPIASNDVSLWIEGRLDNVAPPPPQFFAPPGSSSLLSTYSKCDATQQATVASALAEASNYANAAVTYLGGAASATPRYTTWFGAFSNAGWNTAKSHYAAIKNAYDTQTINFDCGCRKKYYAYVYPTQPYTIYLCSVFWNAPLTGTDSKGGTIIHETSHFNVVAGTDDWAYGQTNAKSLAISDPSKALDNADNHEYFAENNPLLQ